MKKLKGAFRKSSTVSIFQRRELYSLLKNWHWGGFALAVSLTGCVDLTQRPLLIHAARVFDGHAIQKDVSVLIENGKVSKVDKPEKFTDTNAQLIELGDATLLPGLIELHAHVNFHHISKDTILRHGITTLRDVGGNVAYPTGGEGELRFLTAGKIITVPNGYPINKHGETDIAISVTSDAQARQVVRDLVSSGASVIKVALETGGEHGAPWSGEHHHSSSHDAKNQPEKHSSNEKSQAWAVLPEHTVKAIVDEAHKLKRKVTAHVGEARGVEISLNAGVDEWAHTPCEKIPDALLSRAISQGVKMISTIDTLSKCHGVAENMRKWTAKGGTVLYGAEIAHPDIPYGIDAQELLYLQKYTQLQPAEVLQLATSKAGQYLEIPLLGTLQPEAPADLIAVKGNALEDFKLLEYPDLVISGGKVVVNNVNQEH